MPQEKITSIQVAQRAGVSQSAVSRVFSGASASPETITKVRRAAEELGYRPNVLARSLITGKTRIIGLVVAYLENPFYPVALELLSKALQARGYHILIFMAGNATEAIPQVVQELMDYQVDGIITASVGMSNDLTTQCDAAGIPVVMFNRGQDDARLSEVTSDNFAGARRATDFLIKGGHRRIAHVMGWQGSSTGRDRAQGFRAAMADAGIEPVAMADGMYDRDTTERVTREIMRDARPDAILVGNDHMAFAVMDTLRGELGLCVPDDVSVVGYDDVPMAGWGAYGLTTIRQPVRRMVEATVEVLLQQIEGERAPHKVRIDGPLILRTSARKPLDWPDDRNEGKTE